MTVTSEETFYRRLESIEERLNLISTHALADSRVARARVIMPARPQTEMRAAERYGS